ncbi:hypothetical protein E1166_02905, partial [Micromonospora sp. KC213]
MGEQKVPAETVGSAGPSAVDSVATAGPPDTPAGSVDDRPVTAGTGTGGAVPAQRVLAPPTAARASATVPGDSRIRADEAAGAAQAIARAGGAATVYRATPVNPEPPEPAQP